MAATVSAQQDKEQSSPILMDSARLPQLHPAPEWLTTTPPECTYDLVMFGDNGGSVQSIPLTRHEFCELKLTLAHLRGCDTLLMTAADVSEGE